MKLLGIGPRVNYASYGFGIVTNLSTKFHWTTFIEHRIETIDLAGGLKDIEVVENEVDTVSLFDVEKVLKNILSRWLYINRAVAISDKWKSRQLILELVKPTQNKIIANLMFF